MSKQGKLMAFAHVSGFAHLLLPSLAAWLPCSASRSMVKHRLTQVHVWPAPAWDFIFVLHLLWLHGCPGHSMTLNANVGPAGGRDGGVQPQLRLFPTRRKKALALDQAGIEIFHPAPPGLHSLPSILPLSPSLLLIFPSIQWQQALAIGNGNSNRQ